MLASYLPKEGKQPAAVFMSFQSREEVHIQKVKNLNNKTISDRHLCLFGLHTKVLGIESAFDERALMMSLYIVISQQNHTVNRSYSDGTVYMRRNSVHIFFPFPSWPKAVCRAEHIVYIFFSIWLFEFASDSYS